MNDTTSRGDFKKATIRTAVSLRKVLEMNVFKGYRLFAGETGLDNYVSRITINDVPDAQRWFSPGEIQGELCCTTGYALFKNPEIQEQWLIDIARGGAAAVVIKPERFLGTIPERMIKTANQYNLPLIGVPIDVLWPVVIQETMDLMLAQQVQKLQDTYSMHHNLEKLVLSSAGIEKILKTISDIVGCHVVLEDKYFNQIEQAFQDDSDEAMKKKTKEYRKIHIKQSHPEKRQPSGYRRWLIPGDEDNSGITQIIVPVIAGKHDYGWLSAFPVMEDQLDFVRTAMEHGATAVALELLGRYSKMESRTEQINLFLRAMLDEKGLDRSEIIRYGQIWGIDIGRPTMVARIYCNPGIAANSLRKCIDLVKKKDADSLLSVDGNIMYLLYHPTATSESEANEECRKMLYKLISQCREEHYTFYVGVGERVSVFNAEDFRRSNCEAEICLNCAMQHNDTILFYKDIGVARLFPLFENLSAFERMARDVLRPLTEHDESLIYTLQSYVSKGFNKAKAAKDLCIHVNTINYRLSRIQELTGLDLEDVDNCIFYYVAIQAYLSLIKRKEDTEAAENG